MTRHNTTPVRVGNVVIGGGAPVVVQAMTNTDTADVESSVAQCLELARAGADLVRLAVNEPAAAAAVPEIRHRLDDAGCRVPLVGDFQFGGHQLLSAQPDCARTLDKYRINPGTVGTGARHDANFSTMCEVARDNGKAVRIGVNGGSLDQGIVTREMQRNIDRGLGLSSDEVLDSCMVQSAVESTELAIQSGLAADRIVISCKVSRPVSLIRIYRRLDEETRQPLHLGLTEAGIGTRGLVWSSAAMAVLLAQGIGDTIRVSLTPRPGGDRCDEVRAACELLQALGIRSFAPSVVACPGCGRTTSTTFQELAERVEDHVRQCMPQWRSEFEGFEDLTLAVMGCIVNGPGESKAADIGISLPGTGEEPRCPVYIDGRQVTTLHGDAEELAARFLEIVDEYIAERYGKREPRG